MTAMILQNTISRFNFFRIESFDSWVCYFGEPRKRKKKSVECRSKEQRRAFSELSFELALPLWLQWFCKISFPDSTSFEFKVLIAECVLWRATKQNKNRVIFRIGFDVITTMILYLSILPQKGTGKKCWPQQITEEHFEHVLSSLCMRISVCASKLVYFFSLTGCTCCT